MSPEQFAAYQARQKGARLVRGEASHGEVRGKGKAKEPTERQSQATVVSWWAVYCRTKGLDERLLVAVPNGSHLAGDARARAIQMRRLKATGLRVGYPDLILDLPFMKDTWPLLFAGLKIEMKRKGEKPTPEQASYHLLLRNMGYNVVVAIGADEAIRAITAYCDAGRRDG